jgi:L-lactate dehydrogenase complex protein LldF
VDEGLANKAQEIAFKGFENTMRSPALYKISGKAGRVAQKPLLLREGSVRPLPGPTSAWTNSRDLPPLAEKPFRELWKEGI